MAALTIYFCFPAGLLKWSSLAALCLYATSEHRRLIQHGIIRLRVNPGSATIEFEQRGQTYFFRKYKVYESRWFAILKLIDSQQNRTLILIPDSFSSLQSYRRLRHQIRRLERFGAA
ncbi:MAG: hypothetical protein GY875_21960 [Gammaproteobacteria bacterium]|nr:hypothetical protein [Gammaproteobacteria bacterium]